MLNLFLFLYSHTVRLVRSDRYRRPTRSPHVSCGLKLFLFTFVFAGLVGLVAIPFANADISDPLDEIINEAHPPEDELGNVLPTVPNTLADYNPFPDDNDLDPLGVHSPVGAVEGGVPLIDGQPTNKFTYINNAGADPVAFPPEKGTPGEEWVGREGDSISRLTLHRARLYLMVRKLNHILNNYCASRNSVLRSFHLVVSTLILMVMAIAYPITLLLTLRASHVRCPVKRGL